MKGGERYGERDQKATSPLPINDVHAYTILQLLNMWGRGREGVVLFLTFLPLLKQLRKESSDVRFHLLSLTLLRDYIAMEFSSLKVCK